MPTEVSSIINEYPTPFIHLLNTFINNKVFECRIVFFFESLNNNSFYILSLTVTDSIPLDFNSKLRRLQYKRKRELSVCIEALLNPWEPIFKSSNLFFMLIIGFCQCFLWNFNFSIFLRDLVLKWLNFLIWHVYFIVCFYLNRILFFIALLYGIFDIPSQFWSQFLVLCWLVYHRLSSIFMVSDGLSQWADCTFMVQDQIINLIEWVFVNTFDHFHHQVFLNCKVSNFFTLTRINPCSKNTDFMDSFIFQPWRIYLQHVIIDISNIRKWFEAIIYSTKLVFEKYPHHNKSCYEENFRNTCV